MATRRTRTTKAAKSGTSSPTVWRVFRLSKATKQAMRTSRDRSRTTTRAWLRSAVADTLPALLADLEALGLGDNSTTAPARWRWDEEALAEVRAAAQALGLDQRLLVAMLVARHAAANKPRTRKTSRRA